MITRESWPEDWSKVEPWTEISPEVYNHFLNVLMPISHRGAYFQCSEPYDHQLYGKPPYRYWKKRFLTFTKIGRKYYYLGIQFLGEIPERGSSYGKEINGSEKGSNQEV